MLVFYNHTNSCAPYIWLFPFLSRVGFAEFLRSLPPIPGCLAATGRNSKPLGTPVSLYIASGATSHRFLSENSSSDTNRIKQFLKQKMSEKLGDSNLRRFCCFPDPAPKSPWHNRDRDGTILRLGLGFEPTVTVSRTLAFRGEELSKPGCSVHPSPRPLHISFLSDMLPGSGYVGRLHRNGLCTTQISLSFQRNPTACAARRTGEGSCLLALTTPFVYFYL